jgi:ubiquinone/menaquinone biosynthesis C-methylase UbiE
MSFYEDTLLPCVIDLACSSEPMMAFRRYVVPMATGEVLEVGIGSGPNLALYNPEQVSFVWGLEPSEGMHKRAHKNLAKSPVTVKWLALRGEEIPLADNTIDTIVLTYTLCTIPDYHTALQQMYRVLKPGGKLLFCEHGLSPDLAVQKWQNGLTPLWKKMAGGCHLNRPIREYIGAAGFHIEEIHDEYIEKAPRFVGYMTFGWAIK